MSYVTNDADTQINNVLIYYLTTKYKDHLLIFTVKLQALHYSPYQPGQLIYFCGTLKVSIVIYLIEKDYQQYCPLPVPFPILAVMSTGTMMLLSAPLSEKSQLFIKHIAEHYITNWKHNFEQAWEIRLVFWHHEYHLNATRVKSLYWA